MAEGSPVYDVAIVGLGPAGATLANLLGAAGRSVLVVEKEAGIFPLPRAVHFDGEVLRVFQSAGLREEVLAVSRPGTEGMSFVNAAGKTMLVRGGTASFGVHGCADHYYFHQPWLEAVLRTGLKRFEKVELLLRHECVEMDPHDDFVSLGYRASGDDAVHSARARYVVGCDGARSFVRGRVGSSMVDLGLRQPWLVFDVVLTGSADLPEHTVQYCDPRRPMTYCNVVGARRRWEIMVMPGDDRESLVRPETIWKMVAPWLRPDQARLERAAIYTFHSVIADRWRNGRLFLAGDACHQTPPFLGQGMCAGIRDVSNLAWKLEAVLAGRASDALLDTYESERRPRTRAVIELAVRLGNIIQATDQAQAAARDAKFEAGRPEVFEMPPQVLGTGAFDLDPHGIAGQPFPQLRLQDGGLLDDRLGRRMAVIGANQTLSTASAAAVQRWRRSDAIVVDRPDPKLEAWLREHEASAVIVRPDRYIFGVARSTTDLDRISLQLPVASQSVH